MKSFAPQTKSESPVTRTNGGTAQIASPKFGKRTPQEVLTQENSIDVGKVFVVLPAYNEEGGLPDLLSAIEQVFAINGREYHIIVVDDASTDSTAEIAREAAVELPLTLVQHKINQNLPGALRTGFETAIKFAEEHDVIITMDGDNTHPPAIMNLLLQKIAEGYDVMIASRFQPGSRVCGVPSSRVLTAFGARMLFKIIMPIPAVRDYTCGYRAYRANVLRDSMKYYGDQWVTEKGFSCMVDVLLKMRRFNYVMGEVPMLLRYDQKEGCLLYTSPSPRDATLSRMPSSA